MKKDISLQNFINQFIIDDIKPIVENHAYLAFVLLSAAIEFLGKCLSNADDWQTLGESEYDFCNAIQTCPSLNKYKVKFGESTTVKGHNNVYKNKLYKELRCAMVHALQPNSDIVLGRERNDLENNIIGCRELYEDVVKACEHIKSMNISKNTTVYVDGDTTGSTSTMHLHIEK